MVATHSHKSRIIHFSAAYFVDRDDWHYYYIIGLEDNPKMIYIVDFAKHERVAEIAYMGDLDAVIGDVEHSNGYLYVLMPYTKTINVYKLRECHELGHCFLEFQITA